MKTCIMCGGEGTRLRPLTFGRPKPMIPILNKPSLVHLVENLASKDLNDIVITLGYLGAEIETALGDGSMYGVHIEYVYEKEKLGTAGSVKNASEFFEGEPFMVIGGDHVINLDLREFARFHAKHNALVTIGLMPIDDPREYGIADMDANNRINRFFEKPRSGQIFSNLASTGIYMFHNEILEMIPKKKYDFAKDLFPDILRKGKTINGFLVRGKWTDIGNPQAYREACRWMLEQMTSTNISGSLSNKNSKVTGPIDFGHNVSLDSNSNVTGPIIIGENTSIGKNVLIGPFSSIGSNCVIGDNSRILSSYIYDNVNIGENCAISGAVIDNNTKINDSCVLETGTVIGPGVIIKREVTVHSDVRLWPEIVVKEGIQVEETLLNKEVEVVSLIDVNDSVVVDTPNARLICPRKSSQNVIETVTSLKKSEAEGELADKTVFRPWGSYTLLDRSKTHTIKNLQVMPGKMISLQLHNHRREHWVVVKGEAQVHVDGRDYILNEGGYVFINVGVRHRLINRGTVALEIIELQLGDYVGEDDIVRFKDQFGRPIL